MDTGLDENQSELGILVLSVTLEMLADSNSLQRISKVHFIWDSSTDLLDQHVEILWNLWGESYQLSQPMIWQRQYYSFRISLRQSKTEQRHYVVHSNRVTDVNPVMEESVVVKPYHWT